MRILITGGCGFVGRRFVRRLSTEHEVIVVDDMSSGVALENWFFPITNKNCKWHYQDVRDFLRGHKCSTFDLVIHCAATVGGRRLIDGEPLQVATNLSIDSELFYWATHERNYFGLWDTPRKMPKLIYFSSSAIYPAELQTRAKHCKLAETLVDLRQPKFSLPEATYGFSKFCGEYLARCAAERHGLDVAVYRPFGGYGEDQSKDYPFPSIIQRILNNENPVVVWGSGDQQRDFIYIEDVVDAVLATYQKLGAADPLNLGTGLGYSFLTLAELAANELKYNGEITNDATKAEGVFYRVADTAKLSQWYTPTTTLIDGIRMVATHLRKSLTKKVTAA